MAKKKKNNNNDKKTQPRKRTFKKYLKIFFPEGNCMYSLSLAIFLLYEI